MFDKLNFFTHSLGIKILNFKQVGLNVLVLIILLAVVESGDKITGTVIPIFSSFEEASHYLTLSGCNQ